MFVALTFQACSTTKTIYVDKPFEVKVPVKCIVPDVTCDFNQNTDTEVISSMLKCITDLKRASEVCK